MYEQGSLSFSEPLSSSDWTPPEPPSLDGIGEVYVDCETTGLKWRKGKDKPCGIAIGWKEWDSSKISSTYLPFGHISGNLSEDTVRRWAQRELRDKRIVNLNTRFDIHMLREWGVDLEAQGCTVGDVGHYAALLDDHRRHFSLEVISQEYLGEGKVDLDMSHGAHIYPAERVAPYAAKDVELVGRLVDKMWPLMDDEELHTVRELEDDVIFPVCEMEKNATPLDVEKLKAWVTESEQEFLKTLWQVHRETGLRVNPDSNDDLVRLFRHRGIPITAFTETGKPSFTDEVMKGIDDPVIKLVRHAGKLASLRSKYLVSYLEAITEDGLLCYNLHQLRTDDGGTVSGRFSASDKNIQQVMAVEKQKAAFGDHFIVRELFIPGAGMIWLSADAAQIEYRLFAHYAASQAILKAYEENPRMSFHQTTWDLMKSMGVDLLYKQQKNVNFAKIYGAGKKKLALMLGMDQSRANSVIAAYDRLFPEVPRLLAMASRMAETRGYVKTITGRRMRFPQRQRLHKALNGVIQGGAADINKRKIVDLHRERKRTGLLMRMTVHDEVCGDIPDLESARLVEEILNTQAFPELKVPILWDVATGQNWAEAA